MQARPTTLLLNWTANPYHTPIFVAKAKGFYEEVRYSTILHSLPDGSQRRNQNRWR